MSMLPSPSQIAGRHYQLYEAYHYQLPKNPDGSISSPEAARFLQRSGLPGAMLKAIWDMSVPQGRGYLDKSGFFLSLKLITLAQTGKDLSMPNAVQDIDETPEMSDTKPDMTRHVVTPIPQSGGLPYSTIIKTVDSAKMCETVADSVPNALPVSEEQQQRQPTPTPTSVPATATPEKKNKEVMLLSRQNLIHQQLRHQRQQQLQLLRLQTQTSIQQPEVQRYASQSQSIQQQQQLQSLPFQQQPQVQVQQQQQFQQLRQTVIQPNHLQSRQQQQTFLQQQQQLPRNIFQQLYHQPQPQWPSTTTNASGPTQQQQQQQQQQTSQTKQPQIGAQQSQIRPETSSNINNIISQLQQQGHLFQSCQNNLGERQLIQIQVQQQSSTGPNGQQILTKPRMFQMQRQREQTTIQGQAQGIRVQQANPSQQKWVLQQQQRTQQPRMLSQTPTPIRYQLQTGEQNQIIRPHQWIIQTSQHQQQTPSVQPQTQPLPQHIVAPLQKTYQQQQQQQAPLAFSAQLQQITSALQNRQQQPQVNLQQMPIQFPITIFQQQQAHAQVPSPETWENLVNQIKQHPNLFQSAPRAENVVQTQPQQNILGEQTSTASTRPQTPANTPASPQNVQRAQTPGRPGTSPVEIQQALSLQQKRILQQRAQQTHSQNKLMPRFQPRPGMHIVRPQRYVQPRAQQRKQTLVRNPSEIHRPQIFIGHRPQQPQTNQTSVDNQLKQPLTLLQLLTQENPQQSDVKHQTQNSQNSVQLQNSKSPQTQVQHQTQQQLQNPVQRQNSQSPQTHVQHQTQQNYVQFQNSKSPQTHVQYQSQQNPIQLQNSMSPQTHVQHQSQQNPVQLQNSKSPQTHVQIQTHQHLQNSVQRQISKSPLTHVQHQTQQHLQNSLQLQNSKSPQTHVQNQTQQQLQNSVQLENSKSPQHMQNQTQQQLLYSVQLQNSKSPQTPVQHQTQQQLQNPVHLQSSKSPQTHVQHLIHQQLQNPVQLKILKSPQAHVQRQISQQRDPQMLALHRGLQHLQQPKTHRQYQKKQPQTSVLQHRGPQKQQKETLVLQQAPQLLQTSSRQPLQQQQQIVPVQHPNLRERASKLINAAATMSKEMRKKLIRERQLRAAGMFTQDPLIYQFLCAAARASGRIFRRIYNNFPFVYKRITADSAKHYGEFKLFLSDYILKKGADMMLDQWEADICFSGELSKEIFEVLKLAPRYLALIREHNGHPEGGGAPYVFSREEIDGEE